MLVQLPLRVKEQKIWSSYYNSKHIEQGQQGSPLELYMQTCCTSLNSSTSSHPAGPSNTMYIMAASRTEFRPLSDTTTENRESRCGRMHLRCFNAM